MMQYTFAFLSLTTTTTTITTTTTTTDAILLWSNNVEKEFEGMEECPICYYIVHQTNQSLPKLQCRTCRKKFHAQCRYKVSKLSCVLL
jgi:hypothetical protein